MLIFHACVTHFSIKFWKNLKKEKCIKMRQCCTKYYRIPFKWMRGKCPTRIKSKLSHTYLSVSTSPIISGFSNSWFWLLDQYVYYSPLEFFLFMFCSETFASSAILTSFPVHLYFPLRFSPSTASSKKDYWESLLLDCPTSCLALLASWFIYLFIYFIVFSVWSCY